VPKISFLIHNSSHCPDVSHYARKNHGKISDFFCNFPQKFHLCLKMREYLIRQFWGKKLDNFGKITKKSMIFPSVFDICIVNPLAITCHVKSLEAWKITDCADGFILALFLAKIECQLTLISYVDPSMRKRQNNDPKTVLMRLLPSYCIACHTVIFSVDMYFYFVY